MSSAQDPPIPPTSFYGPRASSSSSRQPPTTPPKNDAAAVPQSTPVAYKQSASAPYTSMHFERDFEMRQLGWEMEGKFVGPMPIAEFLDTFLPIDPPPLPWNAESRAAFKAVTEHSSEPAMYIPLIDALTPFCPSLELVDTHNHPDSEAGELKPDIAAYANGCGRDDYEITSFSKMEIHMELKFSDTDDAFQNWEPGDEHSIERDSGQGKDTKGQITSYAAAHLALQFRTFIYSVLICGHGDKCNVRLLRWDRSGAVVTEAFPLREKGLAKFFWRYHHLSLEARGVDISVSLPSEEEADDAKRILHLPKSSALVAISAVNTDDDGVTATFIAGKPAFEFNSSATGRSTRGFVAYYVEEKKIVFLKDSWRIDLDGIAREGEIYQTLHNHQIPYIAPCILSGDVGQHRTRAQDFMSRPWACNVERKKLVPLTHYRLALGIVGAVLTDFKSTRELVVAVGDAFEAHKLAWEKAQILHRDISVGNILITKDGHGLLIDWDLCKHKDDLREAARRDERTGTWQFMAARLLLAEKGERLQHTLQDDMESFVHVLGWLSLRYMKHDLSGSHLATILTDIFDHAFMDEGHARGGGNKRYALLYSTIPRAIEKCSPGFRDLLEKLTIALSVRYSDPPTREMIDEYHQNLKEAREYKGSSFLNVLLKSDTAKYLDREGYISNSDWMLKMFRDALADYDPARWPKRDGAVKNAVLHRNHHPSQRKRKADDELVGQHMPVQKIRSAVMPVEGDSEESQ